LSKFTSVVGAAGQDSIRVYTTGGSFSLFGWTFSSWGVNDKVSIFGSAVADSINGTVVADAISGAAGNDFINGRAGADTMAGGTGNDGYWIDNAGDRIIEAAGEGTDAVRASVSYTMHNNVENMLLEGASAINAAGNVLANKITGNSAANKLSGGSGNDTLNGAAGNDTMNGGVGNDILFGSTGADSMFGADGDDTFYVDNAGDIAKEAAGQGTDAVSSSVSFTLGADIENLALTGASGIAGHGNTLANSITGNAGSNLLTGGSGADSINGGAGADTISGGVGIDLLVGGVGADAFVFDAAVSAANRDSVLDFTVADDIMHLDNAVFTALADGALDQDAFNPGAAATTADHRIIYNSANGKLMYDADGTGAGAAVQFAQLDAGLALTHADFLVI
jgi:Ca2+-binding RTX toxin-like protein